MFFQNRIYQNKPLLNKKNIKFIQKQNLLIEKYEPSIIEHNISVGEISYLIGLNSGKLNYQELSNLYFSALIHDIGKIFLSKKILYKPDRLNKKEMRYVQQHSSLGADHIEHCFSKSNLLGLDKKSKEEIVFNIKHHHEMLDGSGYPNKINSQDIPLAVQILTIADVYSALNEKRVYKNSWHNKDIFNYLKENSNQWFNGKMVNLLENIKKEKRAVNN
jgi:HD-GYP domain-containing protein (c-di-GMP phosphodiesterase class II)